MGDRIVVMKDGFIQQIGAPLEIYDNPVNVFVAGFIGTPPMNFINVVLKKEGDDYWVHTEAFNSDPSGAGSPDPEHRRLCR